MISVEILDLPEDSGHGFSESLRDALQKSAVQLKVPQAELTLCFVDLSRMQAMNRKWRAKNKPTDVLSFPADRTLPGAGDYLGDIVICLEVADAQAREQGHTLVREVAHLAVHGFLHLLGYDHETDHGEMEAVESQLHPLVLPGPDNS